MLNRTYQIYCVFLSFIMLSCSSEEQIEKGTFSKINAEVSGLTFSNDLDEKKLKSIFNYINVYTGGGVAIGDVNNDGLQDIYFAGNMVSSKLYLNKGGFNFEDISVSSRTNTDKWCTAVSMADVNNDGWLDIYVCRAYFDDIESRKNLLFINNKDNTFTEQAEEYGIADANYSIASSFFDYDLDGDLDLYVGNHPRYRAMPLNTHYNYWLNPVDQFSNHLYQNNEGKFEKVTEEAGLLNYGFTLAVSTSDYNLDGYPDIFVTVDHDEPDFIYHNNGDGTFTNVLNEAVNQTSLSSMGIDAGDVNHDKFPDYIVAEMLTEDHYREKVNMSMSNVKRFEYMVDSLKYQYYQMHNFLHLNNGNGTFSDIAQLAKIHKSDWSWATLFMDFDHDGWQDLYISNGLFKDVYNRDRKGKLDSVMIAMNGDMEKMNDIAIDYSIKTEQTKVSNYLFKGGPEFNFQKHTEQARLTDKTISTGAAYGDLDNDGDLDLVVSNLGDKALLYRNNQNDQNFIRVKFETGPKTGVGSKVYLYNGNDVQSREMLLTRGFLSSCEPYVHFGTGAIASVDKVEIIWPDGKMETINNVKPGTTISAKYENANATFVKPKEGALFQNINPESVGIDYVQKENYYFDYDDQVLLPHRMSEYGPFIEVTDVDNNGSDDFIIGSPTGQSTAIYMQNDNGSFNKKAIADFEKDANFEDSHVAAFDANGDGNVDICIGSTGYEFDEGSTLYAPRLYMGNGNGDFTRKSDAFGDFTQSAACIEVCDFDNDGDLDLFIGGRDRPKKYPKPGLSSLWVNDGLGNFKNVTPDIAPFVQEIGMVRDAIWMDLNDDKMQDLIIVGEWMPITVLIQEVDGFKNKTSDFLDKNLSGWWNTIASADLDGNGLNDLVIGNLGYNYKYKASDEKPFIVYTKDFDESGSQDIVLGTYYGDKMYPVRGKNCSSEQIPDLEKKFPTYEEYAHADIVDVYGDALNEAAKYEVNEFGSIILFQNTKGKFSPVVLPNQVQRSPVNAIEIVDVNEDGKLDIITVGNLYQSEIETGRADAGIGSVLLNKGDQEFEVASNFQTGFFSNGDVKSMKSIKIKDKAGLIIGKNKGKVQLVTY